MSTPARPAFALAIEACSEFGLRLSAIQADSNVSSRAASQSVSISIRRAAACDWPLSGAS
jgi:hypothetical protein